MGGMYGGGLPQAAQPQGMGAAPLPQNIMQQSPGDISGQRDRITQALMDVQNPPPVTPMAQQQGMPAAAGAPPMAGAMPGAAAPQAMGGGGMAGVGTLPSAAMANPVPGAGMQGPLGQMGSGVNTSGFGLGQIPQGTAGGDIPGMMQQRAPAGGPAY